jgi:CheY-like chemotaxis protein
MNIDPLKSQRILVIDDNPAIHEDFRKILKTLSNFPPLLEEDEAALFGDAMVKFELPIFEIDSAYQGREGLDMVEKSLRENHPYALAFVDVRMPPGWDGIETVSKIWEEYPDLQVVICTAYSDFTWEDMLGILGFSDRFVILKKPFDNIEVRQLAVAMTKRWRVYQQIKLHTGSLEKALQSALLALKAANIELPAPISDLTQRPSDPASFPGN